MHMLDDFQGYRDELRALMQVCVAPHAAAIDREERIPAHVTAAMAKAGLFASGLPEQFGGPSGSDADPVTAAIRHGLMHEALGAASASVQGLVNVHHMAGSAIARWGSADQKRSWLPRLAAGEQLAAIAITEPNVGSDASAVETRAARAGAGYLIRGEKTWITCGQSAD